MTMIYKKNLPLRAAVLLTVGLFGVAGTAGALFGQEPVKATPAPEALFTSADPKLNANKQVVYHIFTDLLEAGQLDRAGLYLTERYIQHNPNVPSGREGFVTFFKGLKIPSRPIVKTLSTPVVQVVAEGDYVTVVSVAKLPIPSKPGEFYTTSAVDMFRIKDGKADEHWDSMPFMR